MEHRVTTPFSKGIFVLTSENREIYSQMLSMEKLSLLIQVNFITSIGPWGKGIDPFILLPALSCNVQID